MGPEMFSGSCKWASSRHHFGLLQYLVFLEIRFSGLGTVDTAFGSPTENIATTCLGHFASSHGEESCPLLRFAWLRDFDNDLRTEIQLDVKKCENDVEVSKNHYRHRVFIVLLDFCSAAIVETSEGSESKEWARLFSVEGCTVPMARGGDIPCVGVKIRVNCTQSR